MSGVRTVQGPSYCVGNCILNSCVIGAYSYVNADSHLNLCRIGNYCSLANELRLGLPRHRYDCVSATSLMTDSSPFMERWCGATAEPISFPKQCPIVIGHNVWIGHRVIIPAHHPIKIGTGAVIAA